MSRQLLLIFLLALGCMLLAEQPASAQDKMVVLNPYENVGWDAQHRKGNFHAHTTNSDGAQPPAAVIDGYHDRSYSVLALTDHNHVTWPWRDYGRNPDQLGMVPVPGNELSRHHHNLSLFSEYPAPVRDSSTSRLHTSIREVGETGGLNVLAHPGRYWEPGSDRVPDNALARYMGLFYRYDSLVAMEVHNQTNRYPWDRRLWDALLEELMPERPVWGLANDDSHGEHHIGLNASWFPLRTLNTGTVRNALEDGQFYFSTVTTHPERWQDLGRTPRITNVEYDRKENVLTLAAEVEGAPVEGRQVQWISNRGEVVAEGPRIDLDEVDGLSTYLRAEIRSEGALTYTQPFGLGTR